MARNYIKKNQSYWQDKSAKMTQNIITSPNNENGYAPELVGEPYYISSASIDFSDSDYDEDNLFARKSGSRIGMDRDKGKRAKFGNIFILKSPYSNDGEVINIKETVSLCQKAYANIPVFRNAIDVLAEFSASEVYITGGNKTSREFIKRWFKKASIDNLIGQFFLEYYRSGNFFAYRVDGKFTDEDFNKMAQVYGAAKNTLPIRYIVLNPADIFAKSVASFTNTTYVKGISRFEAEKLRNAKTEDDKLIFDNLPKDIQIKIKEGNFSDYTTVQLPLTPDKIHTAFYKKQDYEPFAVPYGYPVLDDINWKLELKKIDQAVCRTVENIVLLVTQGDKDKGVNKKALDALKEIFANEKASRTLVADYTTKVDFIIPDLKKILGKEKYEEVDKDISEGLINLTGSADEKFANQQTKISVFLERLKDGRDEFLSGFLNPEIKRICKNMNFKSYPEAKFQEVNLKDDVALKKITLRLIELGVLTADDGIKALQTGVMPEEDERLSNQTTFKEQKDNGLYVPLTYNGAAKEEESHGLNSGGRPDGTGTPKTTDTKSPIGQGDQSKASLISVQSLIETTKKFGNIFKFAESFAKKQYNVKKLNPNQKQLINNICEAIISKYDSTNWESEVKNCLMNTSNLLALESKPNLVEIEDISQKYSLDTFAAALVFNSKKEK